MKLGAIKERGIRPAVASCAGRAISLKYASVLFPAYEYPARRKATGQARGLGELADPRREMRTRKRKKETVDFTSEKNVGAVTWLRLAVGEGNEHKEH